MRDFVNAFYPIAHRGSSGLAPENTEASFRLAAQAGAREVELDIRTSRDDTIFICHDDTLDRYGHAGMTVESMSDEELLQLDMGSWFDETYKGETMYRLEGLLGQYGSSLYYHIELKGRTDALCPGVCDLIDRHGLWENCIITSFMPDMLETLRAFRPSAKTGWLVWDIDEDTITRAQAMGVNQLCPAAGDVTRDKVEHILPLFEEKPRAWGVSGSREEVFALVKHLIACGIHKATVNWPEWFLCENGAF